VGGDYYDLFETPGGLFGLVVADVSGHGIASALIMSMVKMILKSFAAVEPSPQKTLERINEAFLSDVKTNNFVTIFFAIIDTKNHTIRYTSAGHCPILFLDHKNRSCAEIKADGLFMGVFPSMMLKETTVSYEPGNLRIVLYTDGLIEAKSATDDSMYGLHRLIAQAKDTLDLPAERSIEEIIADQSRFCGPNATAEDDVTVLVVDL
jgi:sigma-B regulation protein RsbU (phosphoserine phosphatase)